MFCERAFLVPQYVVDEEIKKVRYHDMKKDEIREFFSMSMGQQGRGHYGRCGRTHKGSCRADGSSCYKCSKTGHFSRDCTSTTTILGSDLIFFYCN